MWIDGQVQAKKRNIKRTKSQTEKQRKTQIVRKQKKRGKSDVNTTQKENTKEKKQ